MSFSDPQHQSNDSLVVAIRQRWREFIGFSLLFRIVEGLLCAPMLAVVGKWLLGRTVLDSTAVVKFLLSPRGLLALFLAATTLMTLRLVEHAGLSAIFFGAFHGFKISGIGAARIVWRSLVTLVQVSVRFVVLGFLVVLPFLIVAGSLAAWLLPKHDVNYYLKLRPPEFIVAASIIGLTAILTAAVALALLARWRWVVQVVIFEERRSSDAFARSSALSKGIRWKLVAAIIGVSLFSIVLGLIASFLGTASASVLLAVLGQGAASLAVAVGILLLLRTLLGAACSFLGCWVDAGLFTSLYRERVGSAVRPTWMTEAFKSPTVSARWVMCGLATALLFFAGCGVWLALGTFSEIRPVSIHAHRGVSTEAPENSLAAVRAAISAGADYIETDIQLSKDGVPVVAHDSDFSRLGGVARKVADLTYEEIRAIPLSRNVAPEFRDEVTPTFDELLATTKGHVKINIELKYYGDHGPELARKVIQAVRAAQMLDQVVVQCLEYEPLVEVRKLAPEVPVGYLLSFNAREPGRLNVDFLSVEQTRVDHRFVRRAHRRGQQVYTWTVNTVEDIRHQIDLDVDGIITDQSVLARKTVDEMRNRPKLDRFASQIRAWLAD